MAKDEMAEDKMAEDEMVRGRNDQRLKWSEAEMVKDQTLEAEMAKDQMGEDEVDINLIYNDQNAFKFSLLMHPCLHISM